MNYDNDELEILPLIESNDQIDMGTNPNWFKFPCSVIHIASTSGGKGVVACNMIFNPAFDLINKCDEIFLYTGSGKTNDPSMKAFIDKYPENVFHEYSDEHLNTILKSQEAQPRETRKKIAIFVDDVFNLGIKHTAKIWSLTTGNRHWNIVLIHFMVQKTTMVPPNARLNSTYILLGKINNQKELETIVQEYGSYYGKKQFLEALEIATEKPYHFCWLKKGFNPQLYHNFTKHLYTKTGAQSIKDMVSESDKI
jgi:hypothetical protein